MGKAITSTPQIQHTEPMSLPSGVVGTMSPYPTVVCIDCVWSIHFITYLDIFKLGLSFPPTGIPLRGENSRSCGRTFSLHSVSDSDPFTHFEALVRTKLKVIIDTHQFGMQQNIGIDDLVLKVGNVFWR